MDRKTVFSLIKIRDSLRSSLSRAAVRAAETCGRGERRFSRPDRLTPPQLYTFSATGTEQFNR